MIRKLLSLVIMASAVLSLSSCLHDDDNDEITYYDDTAITAFSLGGVRYVGHTTRSDGSDSTYVTTISGDAYKFYIDQTRALIYNPDSLPKGSDASRMVCSISTKNSGFVMLHLTSRWGEDSVGYYRSTDSIDFSSPKQARVYNMRGTAYRDYTIQVNVHQQTGSEFNWSRSVAADGGMSALAGRKIVDNAGTIYLFGSDGTQTVGYRKSDSLWTRLSATLSDPLAYQSMVAKDGRLYTVNDGRLCTSADGETWTTMATPDGLGKLIGVTARNIYGMAASDHHILRSDDNGLTWVSDSLDSDASLLPATSISLTRHASLTNDSTSILVLLGIGDRQTRIWQRVEEDATGSQNQPWAFYSADDNNKHLLPALANLQVIYYNGGLLATGGDGSTFYFSRDNGLSWCANTDYTLPEAFGAMTAEDAFTMTCDAQNIIYISKPLSNEVWSGRIARLGWKSHQTAFTE